MLSDPAKFLSTQKLMKKKLEVLIVDDDEIDAILLKKQLDRLPEVEVNTLWVQNSKDISHALNEKKFDLCFLDQNLGGKKGLDILSENGNNFKNIPVILLTGLKDKDLDLKALRVGAADYLCKDQLEVDVLEKVICQTLERHFFKENEAYVMSKIQENQHFESLGRVTGGLAHEFNNLLTIISGHAELGLKKSADAEQGHFKAIFESAKRAFHLVSQMMVFSGAQSIDKKQNHINEIIHDSQDLFQSVLPHQIHLKIETSEDIPLVPCDVNQVKQVVIHILNNAVEAIGKKRGTITIKTGLRNFDQKHLREKEIKEISAGHYVFLAIEDNGPGMSKEAMHKSLEPFYTTGFIGRGWGLPHALGIMRAHQGTLFLESELLVGTTVFLLFPIN